MWNPATYNKFKAERFAPFYDLLKLVNVRGPNLRVVDLGCGTGELTRKLADSLPGAKVVGIDSSSQMLRDSKPFTNENLHFEQKTMEEAVVPKRQWDLVFSNAAVHWVENHAAFFPKLIDTINNGGQLVIQMPSNHDHYTHTALRVVAAKEPFKTALNGWTRICPVLRIEEYSRILFENGGGDLTVFEKAYPHVMQDAGALFDWVSGTALLPYLEKLPQELRADFTKEYKALLNLEFPETPVFYPFKRILMAATF